MSNKDQISAAYTVLECEFGASEEDVKSSYRQLVKVWHPDRFETDTKLKLKATEKMKLINEAYQLLVDYYQEHDSGQAPHKNAASFQSTKSGSNQNQQQPSRAEFVAGSETFKIRTSGSAINGDLVFHKEVVKIIDFDGLVISQQTKKFRSKPLGNAESFEFAAKHSLSFSLPLTQGVERKIYQVGIQRDDYDETEFTFSDRSSVLVENRIIDILRGRMPDWHNPRFSLADIQEDFQSFKDQQNWKQCVLFGQKAVDLHPQSCWGWVHRSRALHCLSITESALEGLEQAISQFPKETSAFYDLACYSARLGNETTAKERLKTVFKLSRKDGSFDRYHRMALSDLDLASIRGAIPQLALMSSVSRFF